MPIATGTRIGHYEIIELAGVGGMGEVYRVRDTQLKRDAALKILPESLLYDSGRKARFRREAEILASLNHPGIATIHGFIESGDTSAIVMEFVDGDTLADRVKQGPLPIETVDAYARQIIAALEYAHDHGVTHRDLKPANIKITPEGTLKLLDFGLAKAVEDPSGGLNPEDSPTLTLGHTRAGVILGTADYMSPEQAVGKPADRRADIFSFGVVLYEMLAGHRAFSGESGPEILASVVKDQPDWSKLPADTPPALRSVLERCLVKDRRQRMQAIGEARIALDSPGGVSTPKARVNGTWGWIAAAVFAAVASVALWGWLKPAPVEPRGLVRFAIKAPDAFASRASGLTLSRDGSRLLFDRAGVRRADEPTGFSLFLRTMDDEEAKPIPGTEGALRGTFSSQGDWIAFVSGPAPFQLKKIPVSGGDALTLAEDVLNTAPTWSQNGDILFATASGSIYRIPGGAGKPETVVEPDPQKGRERYIAVRSLRGTENVLAMANENNVPKMIALHPRTRNEKVLLEGRALDPTSIQFAPTAASTGAGHLLYLVDGSLFGMFFNSKTLETGPESPVLSPRGSVGVLSFSVSDSGTLAYATGVLQRSLYPFSTMIWADRQGMEVPIAAPARRYVFGAPYLSPDGGRISLTVVNDLYDVDLWVWNVARQTLGRVTQHSASELSSGVWTPDGSRLVYDSNSQENTRERFLYSVAADGSSPPVKLGNAVPVPQSLSRDGVLIGPYRAIVAGRGARGRGRGSNGTEAIQLWTLRLTPDGSSTAGQPERFLDNRFTRATPVFSPDGRWVAFASYQNGPTDIFVVPYPGPGALTQISTGGGIQPRWSRNGRELFFRSGNKMMATDVDGSGPVFRAGTPRVLFEKSSQYYDVHPDGQRFLMFKPAENASESPAPEYHVVLHWFEELRRLVPLRE